VAALAEGMLGKIFSKNCITNMSMIIPGNIISTPASTFSNTARLNFLKLTTEIASNAGITTK